MPSAPGSPTARASAGEVRLGNAAFSVSWQRAATPTVVLSDHWSNTRIELPAEPFRLKLRDGREVLASQMVAGRPRSRAIPIVKGSPRLADRIQGREVRVEFRDAGLGLRVDWRAELREGSHYVRTEIALTADRDLDVAEVEIPTLPFPGARVEGRVPGSPVFAEPWFGGFEHPMSEGSRLLRRLPLRAGQTTTYTAVVGVSPAGQLRRAFGHYLNRERARPYGPFLHYNSWYDLGFFTRFDADQCVERIHAFGRELVKERGVKLASYLFDDGWDETSTVWEFHSGFPRGFAPLREASAQYRSAPGIWLSPWGGYGKPRQERLATGARLGYEIDAQGYALSGPKYYPRFREVTLQMVRDYGINHFKFDGTGSPDKQFPGSAFGSDFEAAIALIHDLRMAQPKLFINLTTGTWPSPFWVQFADSIWRGGSDHAFSGVGPDRQRWITYRDGDTFRGVVQLGPLYPLNSLMLHGLIFAEHAKGLNSDPSGAFRDEIRSYFASGTQLQEMYITPSLLTEQNWDDLAEAAKWTERQQAALQDVQWVGGDPSKLDVYGWAGWSGTEAVLTLRNPKDKPQAFSVDLAKILNLPQDHPATVTLRSPWSDESRTETFPLRSERLIVLQPFEVLTLEGALAARFTLPNEAAPTPPAPVARRDGPIRVACIGDSITFGGGTQDPTTQSYPAQLQRMLGEGYAVRNFGIGGSAILRTGSRPYVDQPEYRAALTSEPDVVVLSFGVNDANRPNWSKGADTFAPFTREMIKAFQDLPSRPRVLLALPPPVYSEGDDRITNLEISVRPILRQVAREMGVTVIDLHGALFGRPELQPDRIHPSAEGASVIAEEVYEALVDPRAVKSGWSVVSASSEQPGEGPAKHAIDGDPATYWHTQWSPNSPRHPHELVVDMGKTQSITGFRYLPRQDGGVNGTVAEYEFSVSLDGTNWTVVSSGRFAHTAGPTRVRFGTAVDARYFRFIAKSEINNGPWATAAEMDVMVRRS